LLYLAFWPTLFAGPIFRAKDFFEQLKNNNIIGTKIYEEQGKWTRITVGTMQEMQKFIGAIQ
jgi:histidinol-phosphate aminotransferase